MENRNDLVSAVFKLSRAMRRGVPHPGFMGPARALAVLAGEESVTSREFSERLDIRPSSATDLLDRMEKEGVVTRTPDENDRRVIRVSLTEKGKELAEKFLSERTERDEKLSACFTPEEKERFIALCEKLSDHLNSMASERPDDFGFEPPFGGHGRPHHHHHHGFGFPPPPPGEEGEW